MAIWASYLYSWPVVGSLAGSQMKMLVNYFKNSLLIALLRLSQLLMKEQCIILYTMYFDQFF